MKIRVSKSDGSPDGVFVFKAVCPSCDCGRYGFYNAEGGGLFVMYSRKEAEKAAKKMSSRDGCEVIVDELLSERVN